MEIQLADDVRAELMRLLHEERDKDRALLERLVAHLTVPPRSTWRVVELAGDDTPHDVGIEFPAQVVYVDNGSTANVQVRAPGDIAQSPPIAASGQGAWLIPGATQLTVTGTGTGQVRLRFLNEAASRLLYTGGPGGSTASPVYAELTGSSAPLTAGAPKLIATIPYTDLPNPSVTVNVDFLQVLSRNARYRDWLIESTLNQGATLAIYPGDSTIGFPGYTGSGIGLTGVYGGPGHGAVFYPSGDSAALAAHVDSFQAQVTVGATAPTAGDIQVYVVEVF